MTEQELVSLDLFTDEPAAPRVDPRRKRSINLTGSIPASTAAGNQRRAKVKVYR